MGAKAGRLGRFAAPALAALAVGAAALVLAAWVKPPRPLLTGLLAIAAAALAALGLERRRSVPRLRESERRHRLLADHARDIIWTLDLVTGRITYVSPACERVLGFTPDEQMQRVGSYSMLTPASASEARSRMEAALRGEADALRYEAEHYTKTGDTIWCEVNVGFLRDAAGRPVSAIGVTRDISERRRMERSLAESQAALRHAQKLEAVGQLTGGVAHDFNNLLSVIVGNLELLAAALPAASEQAGMVEQAQAAAARGAALTRQLLAFARRQTLRPEAIDLNELLDSMEELLGSTVGEIVDLKIVRSDGLWPCVADGSQTANMILNLAINARDAMPDGGTLRFETANTWIGEQQAAELGVAPGPFVLLTASDDGTGMPAEVRERAFDPFFTTKESGRGTGLGLSMVHGFVKQSGGHVELESELGAGTTARVFLPRASREVTPRVEESGPGDPDDRGRGELVLVVEDDAALRRMLASMLSQLGYRSVLAPDGRAALALLDAHRDVAAVVSDVVLPGGVNGFDLAREVRRRRPEIGVLHLSGYAQRILSEAGMSEDPAVSLLQKPFEKRALARHLRRLLHERRSPTEPPTG